MPRVKRVLSVVQSAQLEAAVDALFVAPCHPRDVIAKNEVYGEVFAKCGLKRRAGVDWHKKQVLVILHKKGMADVKSVRVGGKVAKGFCLRRADDIAMPEPTRLEEREGAYGRGDRDGQDRLDRLKEEQRDEARQRGREHQQERLQRASTRPITRSQGPTKGPSVQGVSFSSDYVFD